MEEVFVPALGMAMEEVILLEWQKNPGDAINIGDVIAIVETDKAVLEITAETAGVLGRHRFNVNDSVLPGGTVSVVLAPGESE